MKQLEKLREDKWDNLIILDACRYDYFESAYKAFLRGKLQKVISPASCTVVWLSTCWDDYYDLIYVSGGPYVNSKGVPVSSHFSNKYVAKEHFKKIIDVWNFGWNEELETVLPEAINKAVIELTDKTNLIIHYLQPHSPYIGKTRVLAQSGKEIRLAVLGKPTTMYKQPKTWQGQISKLRKAYSENLNIVLGAVSKLIPLLTGKTIVTSDHGELLGEQMKFFHPCEINHPILREVPWFEVETTKNTYK